MSNRLLQWAMRWQVPAAALDELMSMDDIDDSGTVGPSEMSVLKKCRLQADVLGGVLWRNNSGATFDKNGRMIRYGLGNDSKKLNRDYKMPDLVGIRRDGRFWSAEIKRPGWSGVSNDREKAQANAGRHIESLGGLFTFATDPAHITEMMNR